MTEVFLKLLNMSIAAGWLVLAVILLRLLFRRMPKWLRCVFWALVAVRLLCPVSFESVLSLIPSAETIPENILITDAPAINSGLPFLNHTVNPMLSETLAPKAGESANPMQVILTGAAFIWAFGVLGMLAYLAISFLRIRKRVREAVCLKDNIWLCDHIATPFILGLFRPRIYLPSAMEERDMEYVLRHEKAHLRRHDQVWKPLGFFLLAVYWFNPILWAAYVLLCRDIELACDERVMKEMGAAYKKPYANALINCSAPHRMIAACPLAFGEVGIKTRVKSVLNYKKPAFWIMVLAVAACAVTAVCLLTNPKKENTSDSITKHFEKIPVVVSEHMFEPSGDRTYNFLAAQGNAASAENGVDESVTAQYRISEIVYDNGSFSLTIEDEIVDTQFLISDGCLLWNRHEEGEEWRSSWAEIGALESFSLEKSNFDDLFLNDEIWTPGYTAQGIREDTAADTGAAGVEHEWNGLKQFFYYLPQPDGALVCHGFYMDSGKPFIRWVYKLVPINPYENGQTKAYTYLDSVEPVIMPSFQLSDVDKTFTFTWSAFSSYFAHGTYELTEDSLTLKTYDGLYTFVFDAAGEDRFVFNAGQSAAIPQYKYSSDGEPQSPVPDGAVFQAE